MITFTKEIIETYDHPEFGHFSSCNIYQVKDGSKIIAEFFLGASSGHFKIGNRKLELRITKRFFNQSRYEIVDFESQLLIGHYEFKNWQIGWKYIGALFFNGEQFLCNRKKALIRNNAFKKKTWGHYALELKEDNKSISYYLKVETGWFQSTDAEFKKATGEIHTDTNNITLATLGLFFIERMLHNVDEVSSF